MTTYYPDSKGITKAEIAAVSDWMAEKGLLVVSFSLSFPPFFLGN
jgi:dipeptidyl-peptidase-3